MLRALLLLSAAACAAPTRFITDLQAGKARTMVVFGTSLTKGGAWVGLTDAYLKSEYPGLATVRNEGASGHASSYGLRIIGNVTRHKPDLALIEFCMNDAYYPERDGFKEGVPPSEALANLAAIVDSIKASNEDCEIVLQTMDLPLGIHRVRRPNLEAYHDGYRAFAKARGFRLIDHALRWKAVLDFDTALYVSWLPDSIHPSAAGSAAITAPAVLAALNGDSVAWESPAAGVILAPATAINLRARALRPAGTGLARVDFWQGKAKLGSATGDPAVFAWAGAAPGRYLLMARLVEGETALGISDLRAIEIKAGTAARSNPRVTGSRPSPRRGTGFWLGRRCGTCR